MPTKILYDNSKHSTLTSRNAVWGPGLAGNKDVILVSYCIDEPDDVLRQLTTEHPDIPVRHYKSLRNHVVNFDGSHPGLGLYWVNHSPLPGMDITSRFEDIQIEEPRFFNEQGKVSEDMSASMRSWTRSYSDAILQHYTQRQDVDPKTLHERAIQEQLRHSFGPISLGPGNVQYDTYTTNTGLLMGYVAFIDCPEGFKRHLAREKEPGRYGNKEPDIDPMALAAVMEHRQGILRDLLEATAITTDIEQPGIPDLIDILDRHRSFRVYT